ncbi:MAG: hypothetical protein LLG20_21020 [Acidobacteriales bacterium]|nr:hypothetical protein [Terriglobales bacterium]
MYPNILLSVLILIVAILIIGQMLGNRRLSKVAAVGLVLFTAATLILWLLLGLNPVPGWFVKSVRDVLHLLKSIKF